MIANTLSPCIATAKVAESRDFYVKHFGAKVTFDCGWYVNMQIGKETSELQFMAPREPGPPACNPAGLMYNFLVADVDAEYARLTAAGLRPVMPLADHPWGDRGFAILDPNGVTLYIYSPREPAQEFQQYVFAGGGKGRMPKPFHFDLSADEPERAAEFYRTVFDWKVEKWTGPSDYWMMRTGDEKEPGITGGVAARLEPRDTTVMMIDVPDVDRFAERVTMAGGTIREPKQAISGVGYLVTCRDTDGNTFGIMQLDQNAK